jgi:hypothetical protein
MHGARGAEPGRSICSRQAESEAEVEVEPLALGVTPFGSAPDPTIPHTPTDLPPNTPSFKPFSIKTNTNAPNLDPLPYFKKTQERQPEIAGWRFLASGFRLPAGSTGQTKRASRKSDFRLPAGAARHNPAGTTAAAAVAAAAAAIIALTL